MVIVELIGGLGNQLFQYAAAAALAARHNTTVKMDVSGFANYKLRSYLLDEFTLPQDIATEDEVQRLRGHKVFAGGRLARFLPTPRNPHLYVEPHFHYDPRFEALGDDVYLRGYFQSETYFARHAETIRARFRLKNFKASAMASQIEAAPLSVSLHVRRGDYVTNQAALTTHGSVGLAYYQRALNLLTALHGTPQVFVFSDDIAWVKEHMPFIPNPIFMDGDTERPQDDLHLMSLCHHHIIANSSFSWWGAWLNHHTGKNVIAPRAWFAPDKMREMNTVDIYPAGWILL